MIEVPVYAIILVGILVVSLVAIVTIYHLNMGFLQQLNDYLERHAGELEEYIDRMEYKIERGEYLYNKYKDKE